MDKTKMAIDVFDKCADAYQDKFMDLGLYHDSLDLFCKHIIKDDAKVLDIACGPGNITHYLLKRRPHLKILGIDLSPKMIALAQKNNPQAEFQVMDCRDIVGLDKIYDGLMCGFYLPYITKEESIEFIKNASKVLTINGLIYISTMEDDYSQSGFKTSSSGDSMFIHYHQADYLTQALNDSGFNIIDLRRQIYSSQDDKPTIDLIIIAEKYG